MAHVHAQVAPASVKKDWPSTLGMFAHDAVMQDIDEEGRKIREVDRRQAKS